jgi:hypothetical protein
MDNWMDRYWLYPEQQWRLVLKKKLGNGTHPMMRRKGTPAAVGFVPHRGQPGTSFPRMSEQAFKRSLLKIRLCL